jgi:3',5'-cyclic AMP phosphodiesterase CpdA
MAICRIAREKLEMSNPFRIVHLSDLHLTAGDGDCRSETNLFAPLRGMNQAFRRLLRTRRVQDADLVLVTGDVTDRGKPDTWKVFWDAAQQAGLLGRVLVVPGNHDVGCLGARLPFRKQAYREADLQKAIDGLTQGNQPIKFPWVRVPDPRVAVFGLNSNNLGNFTVLDNAMGEIGYYQLKALASKMYMHRNVPVKIVALHHSPNIPGVDTARKRGQRPVGVLERMGHQIPQDQRHGLLLLCIAHRVRLVLHGHLHDAENRRVSGIRIVGTPASTEPDGRGAYRFFTYTVHGDGGRVDCQLESVALEAE